MTSSRPYLVRAFREWIADNGLTPHLVVDAEMDGTEVPREHVHEGRIVLNVSASAVRDLELGNEWISFAARFSGRSFSVLVPTRSVLAVYAKENGVGMVFKDEEPEPSDPSPDPAGRPNLRVVK